MKVLFLCQPNRLEYKIYQYFKCWTTQGKFICKYFTNYGKMLRRCNVSVFFIYAHIEANFFSYNDGAI